MFLSLLQGNNEYSNCMDEINFSASKGFAGYCVSTGEVVNVADAYQDDRFNRCQTQTDRCHKIFSRCSPDR